MSNKYNSRYLPVVSRDESFTEQTSSSPWCDEFLKNYNQSSTSNSIYDEISAILNNSKSKFSSVEEAVKDLKERTGLDIYLESFASIKEPEIFKKIPEMRIFIENYIEDHPGTSIESVVYEILNKDHFKEQLPDNSDVENEVKQFINNKLSDVYVTLPDNINMHVGKVDQSSENEVDDPLKICEPNKV